LAFRFVNNINARDADKILILFIFCVFNFAMQNNCHKFLLPTKDKALWKIELVNL